ncbi:hypothetical protein PMAYCL1PPCAC_16784, partial [Pristionchus mayeri]
QNNNCRNTMSALQERLGNMMMGGLVVPTIALGKRLGLFEALAEVASESAPAEARTVAEKAGCKERYVREWLAVLSCAGFIEITPDEKFWLTEEAKHEFSGLNNLLVAEMLYIPAMLKNFYDLEDAFKREGRHGLEYSQFAEFDQVMDVTTKVLIDKHLISDYMPLIGVSDNRAADGLKVLDIGCGTGSHARKIASAYPKIEIHGADISASAIAKARESSQGLSNLTFHVEDAAKMPSEWTESFDLITIFDACHEQARPDLSLKEVLRMLKSGGTFAMLEPRATSNIHSDKTARGPFSAAPYAISLFHCLPVGSNAPDALCLGMMWGEGKARKLIEEAGFKKELTQVLEPSFSPAHLVYVCKKE